MHTNTYITNTSKCYSHNIIILHMYTSKLKHILHPLIIYAYQHIYHTPLPNNICIPIYQNITILHMHISKLKRILRPLIIYAFPNRYITLHSLTIYAYQHIHHKHIKILPFYICTYQN